MATAQMMPGTATEHGLYGPGSVTWKVNREMVLLAGGGRALILQVSHPLVAAGVEQHSNYDTDPWGRLYRTLDLTTKIVFGDRETCETASQRLHATHGRVKGTSEEGVAYDARDPDLLTWVWATLVESSLLIYTGYVRPLGLPDMERYYEEQKLFAHATGIPEGHYPASYAEFTDYCRTMVEDELRATPGARRVVDATLRPKIPLPAKPIFKLVNLITVGLLPPRLRSEFGLDWGPRRERLLAASAGATRRLLPLLPGLVHEFPPARSAARRFRAAA